MRTCPICPAILMLWTGCGTAKHGIADGRYRQGRETILVEVLHDTIHLLSADAGSNLLRLPPVVAKGARPGTVNLSQHSFDVDLLTIPVKYRPAAPDLQPQLETQVNASLY